MYSEMLLTWDGYHTLLIPFGSCHYVHEHRLGCVCGCVVTPKRHRRKKSDHAPCRDRLAVGEVSMTCLVPTERVRGVLFVQSTGKSLFEPMIVESRLSLNSGIYWLLGMVPREISLSLLFSPNSVGTLRCSYGRERRERLIFIAIYSTFMPLDIVHVHFDCAGSQNLGGWSACLSRLRSRCGAVRILVHGVNLEVQISRQAQHFVNLEVQISWQAQHFVNLEVQISWQAQRMVNLEVQISWQAQHLLGEPRSVDFVAGAVLCAVRSQQV